MKVMWETGWGCACGGGGGGCYSSCDGGGVDIGGDISGLTLKGINIGKP